MKLLAVLALVACETQAPTPSPVVPEPPPPAPPDAALTPDAPVQAVADPQCGWIGPKELITIRTDPATNRGLLHRMTTGPVPSRYIQYTVRPDGPLAFDLVFDRYDKDDYWRMWNAKPSKPRERLERGKSVIARVYVQDGKSYIKGVAVDLHTGMRTQPIDHAYPCGGP